MQMTRDRGHLAKLSIRCNVIIPFARKFLYVRSKTHDGRLPRAFFTLPGVVFATITKQNEGICTGCKSRTFAENIRDQKSYPLFNLYGSAFIRLVPSSGWHSRSLTPILAIGMTTSTPRLCNRLCAWESVVAAQGALCSTYHALTFVVVGSWSTVIAIIVLYEMSAPIVMDAEVSDGTPREPCPKETITQGNYSPRNLHFLGDHILRNHIPRGSHPKCPKVQGRLPKVGFGGLWYFGWIPDTFGSGARQIIHRDPLQVS